MKVFHVKFRKNGLPYETYWKAEDMDSCMKEIETVVLDGIIDDDETVCPQNAIFVCEEVEE